MQYTLLNYKPFLTFHRIIQQRRKYIMESRIKSKRLNYSELFSITTEIYKKYQNHCFCQYFYYHSLVFIYAMATIKICHKFKLFI